jgi:hypothetical protein
VAGGGAESEREAGLGCDRASESPVGARRRQELGSAAAGRGWRRIWRQTERESDRARDGTGCGCDFLLKRWAVSSAARCQATASTATTAEKP